MYFCKKSNNERKTFFHNHNETWHINPSSILYVIADDNYSVVYLSTVASFHLSMQLGDVLQKMQLQLPLTCDDFVRMGRSLIINLTYLHYICLAQGKLELLNRNQDKVVLKASEESLRRLMFFLDN